MPTYRIYLTLLGARPAPFASAEAMERLDRVRAEYDPQGRFHSWMGRV